MNRRRLDELAQRLAALEAAVATEGPANLGARLAAIEEALRRLRHGDQERREIDGVARDCAELLDQHVPGDAPVAVMWEGEPALLAFGGRAVVPFPDAREAEDGFEHGIGAIAQLEAQRAQGTAFLLVPGPARSWLRRHPQLEEHLLRHYEVIADGEAGGMLIDVGSRRAAQESGGGVGELLDRVLDGDRYSPVLDWTDFDLASLTSDRNLFATPPVSDGELPYLDRTIDVVIVADPAHLPEGRRVASRAVVLVSPAPDGGVEVAAVERLESDPASASEPILLVVAGRESEDPWASRVAEAVAEVPAITIVVSADPWSTAREADAEVVAIAERGVLPLPGCIEIAATTLRRSELTGAVAVKLLAANGRLEAAGSTVFADGSVEGVGAGSSSVAAGWHEYLRPVCATNGLLVARASALRRTGRESRSFPELTGALWAAGFRVVYQPDTCAVRALPAEGPQDEKRVAAGWDRALSARPARPTPLDDTAWRRLLAADEVEECWR